MLNKETAKTTVYELTISYQLVNGDKATLSQQIDAEKEAKSKYRNAVSNFKPHKVLGRRLTQLDITTVRTVTSSTGKLLIDE